MKTLSMSAFQNDPSYFVKLAKKEGFVITKNDGTAVAVVLSIEEFQSMQAMIRLSGNINRLSELYEIQENLKIAGNTEKLTRLA